MNIKKKELLVKATCPNDKDYKDQSQDAIKIYFLYKKKEFNLRPYNYNENNSLITALKNKFYNLFLHFLLQMYLLKF